MKLITISGLDGSGKSTQIKMLKNYLEQQGSKIFYFHAVAFSLANKLKRGNDNTKSVTTATPFQIWLRKIFLRIDIERFKLLRSKLRNKGYDYILSDRYFYDTVINIKYLSLLTSNVRKILTSDVRKPDLAIYLQTNPNIIMSRDRIPDQGLEYLQTKKELYDAKIDKWNWKVINGNRDKEEIFEEIKNYV